MKTLLKVLAVIILLAIVIFNCVYFFGTSDLRTEMAEKEAHEAKAKTLLQEMANAHQIHFWDSLETYSVEFEDQFYGLMGKAGNPFGDSQTRFLLQYIPKSFDGALHFLNGRHEGTSWGIQSWKSYTQENGQPVVFKSNMNIEFWLPTYQYFIEFPARILQANALTYAGEKTIAGVLCEGVLASWNTIKPQRKIDQYLIWINSETKRIEKVEYTVREMYNFLTGAAYYKDYKDYEGILLPARMPVESNLVKKGKLLHEMRILDFKKDPVEKKVLRPDPDLPVMGNKK